MTVRQLESPMPFGSRAAVFAAIDAYLADGDGRPLDEAVTRAAVASDMQSFALMRGSGNAMSPFGRFLALALHRDLVSKEEAVGFLLSAGGEQEA